MEMQSSATHRALLHLESDRLIDQFASLQCSILKQLEASPSVQYPRMSRDEPKSEFSDLALRPLPK
jgi:hypothetical protein